MEDSFLPHSIDSPSFSLEEIQDSLNQIHLQLIKELTYKQHLIERKDQEINQLKLALAEQNHLVEDLNKKVLEIEKNNEGNKQLNNKLISELVRKQQDIEWYKRTYESRSLIGTLKEKIFGGGHKK